MGLDAPTCPDCYCILVNRSDGMVCCTNCEKIVEPPGWAKQMHEQMEAQRLEDEKAAQRLAALEQLARDVIRVATKSECQDDVCDGVCELAERASKLVG